MNAGVVKILVKEVYLLNQQFQVGLIRSKFSHYIVLCHGLIRDCDAMIQTLSGVTFHVLSYCCLT